MYVYSKMCLELNPGDNSVVSNAILDDDTRPVTVPIDQTGITGRQALIIEAMLQHHRHTITNAIMILPSSVARHLQSVPTGLTIMPLLPANAHHSDSDCDSLPELVEATSYSES
jgi:hypothetical protein